MKHINKKLLLASLLATTLLSPAFCMKRGHDDSGEDGLPSKRQATEQVSIFGKLKTVTQTAYDYFFKKPKKDERLMNELPGPAMELILSHLSLKDSCAFTSSCRRIHTYFNPIPNSNATRILLAFIQESLQKIENEKRNEHTHIFIAPEGAKEHTFVIDKDSFEKTIRAMRELQRLIEDSDEAYLNYHKAEILRVAIIALASQRNIQEHALRNMIKPLIEKRDESTIAKAHELIEYYRANDNYVMETTRFSRRYEGSVVISESTDVAGRDSSYYIHILEKALHKQGITI